MGQDVSGFVIPENPPDEDVCRPMFTPDQMISLVANAKRYCTVQQLAFLAVSTTYGLRRAEIAALRPEDFTPSGIRITTFKKKGRHKDRSMHRIPAPTKSFIRAYDWKPIIPTSTASRIFKDICLRGGIAEHHGYGWHSIRRCLVSALWGAGLHPITVNRFMRWSGRADVPDMVSLYTQTSAEEIDNEVFAAHPFLPLWEKT